MASSIWQPTPEYFDQVIDICQGQEDQKEIVKEELKPLLEEFGYLDLHRFPPDFRWNLCSGRMTLGDFSCYDGWLYRSNWSMTYQGYNGFNKLKIPKWDGRPVNHLVILGEQGIGDEILYASVIPELIVRLGPKALEYQCHPRVQKIMARSFGIRCTDRRNLSEVEEGDATVALSDLMMWYRQDLSHFPRKPFLKVDPVRKEYWRKELEKIGKGPKIGIAWKGRHGEVDKDALVGACPDSATTISVQYGEDDIGPDPIEDIDDHMAFIANLDKIVTTTQTVVHEAGSIGVPVDVIRPLPGTGEKSQLWYYAAGDCKHPVYPNVNIYSSVETWQKYQTSLRN